MRWAALEAGAGTVLEREVEQGFCVISSTREDHGALSGRGLVVSESSCACALALDPFLPHERLEPAPQP